jgi:hypothetical protein
MSAAIFKDPKLVRTGSPFLDFLSAEVIAERSFLLASV